MKLNLTFIFLILLSFLVYGAETPRRYLNSPEDLYIHTRNHVNNVQRLTHVGLELLKSDPEKWRPVFDIPTGVKIDENVEKIVVDLMGVHDDAKLKTSEEFLKKHDLKRPLINDLYEKVGKTVTEVYASKSNDPTISHLNRVDGAIGDELLKSRNIPESSWIRKFVFGIEKIIDPVERSENPVTSEEMGRPSYKESGRPLFKIQNDKALTLSQIKKLMLTSEFAKELENRYSKVAVHFDTLKEKYMRLKDVLVETGAYRLPLDQFAEFELIGEYEKKYGEITDLDDKNLSNKFKNFLFHTPEGQKVLIGRIPSSARSQVASTLQKLKQQKSIVIKDSFNILNNIDCQKQYMLIP